jgi:tRNA threonylcarbamoyladenosine modification (KEOPS) complex Cgi121 subunit
MGWGQPHGPRRTDRHMDEPYLSDDERRDLTAERNNLTAANRQTEKRLKTRGVTLGNNDVIALQVATLRDLIVGEDADKTLHYEVAYQRRVAVTLKAIEDDLARQTIATPAKVLHLPSPG